MQNQQYQNQPYQQGAYPPPNMQYQQPAPYQQPMQYSQNPQYQQQNIQPPQNQQYQQNPQYQQNTQFQQGTPQQQGQLQPGPPPAPEPVPLTPEQEQQLARFGRIFHLTMFPLYTGAETAKRMQMEQDSIRFQQDIAKLKADTAGPKLSTTENIGLKVVGAATGTSFFTMDKALHGVASFAGAVDSLGAATANKVTDVITIERWASPPDATYPAIIVDMLLVRGIKQTYEGAWCIVKANRDFKVKIGTKYDKKIKRGDKWSKTVRGHTEVSIVEKGTGEFKLEKVRSEQMEMASTDWVNVQKRFKKQWVVPS